MSWRDSAACLGDGDPDAWFAEPREKARVRHALATCHGCPVRTQCLDFAMARNDQFGIWGGLTEQDRKRLLAAARRPAAPAAPGPEPRDLSPMDRARQLGDLLARHGSITATARAAGMSRTRVTFLLDLLDLDEGTQARVHAGNLKPEVAVGAVRSELPCAKRASMTRWQVPGALPALSARHRRATRPGTGRCCAGYAQAGAPAGFEPLWLPGRLFGFQQHLAEWAIRQGRGALLAEHRSREDLIELTWAQNAPPATRAGPCCCSPRSPSARR